MRCFAGALLVCLCAHSSAQTLPAPGFVWSDTSKALGARFAIPSDWHTTTSQGKLRGSFTAVPTRAATRRVDVARFTVNIVDNLQSIASRSLRTQIADFIEAIVQKTDVRVLSEKRLDHASYRGMSITFSNEAMTEHRTYLAHKESDALLIISFRAPTSNWPEVWSTVGDTMTQPHAAPED